MKTLRVLGGIAVLGWLATAADVRGQVPIQVKLTSTMADPANPYESGNTVRNKAIKVKITTKDILALLGDAWDVDVSNAQLWIYDSGENEYFTVRSADGDVILDTGLAGPSGFYFYAEDGDDISASRETPASAQQEEHFIKFVYFNDDSSLLYFQLFGRATRSFSAGENGRFREAISFEGHGDQYLDESVAGILSGGFSGKHSGVR